LHGNVIREKSKMTADRKTADQQSPPTDPSLLVSDLGEQVRRLRQERGMTLEEVSAQSGCSVGLLSQLERGKGNPAFFTLAKIAHALGVPVARLVHMESSTQPVVRRGEGRRLNPHPTDHAGAVYELLTPDLDRALEVVRYELPPGLTTEETPFVHGGEEAGVILRGVQEININGVLYTLHAGDAISFQSMLPHWFRNPGPEVVEGIFVCTPPTF
jgi:transcriptional regulator with XRE-family HTH domain